VDHAGEVATLRPEDSVVVDDHTAMATGVVVVELEIDTNFSKFAPSILIAPVLATAPWASVVATSVLQFLLSGVRLKRLSSVV
jgi:hypothetical protein